MTLHRYFLAVTLFISFSSILNAQFDSLIYNSRQRTFLVHLPASYDGQAKIPLLIAMHGGGGSALNLQNQSGLSLAADQNDFIVVYPEGYHGGFLNIRTWNAGWCCGYSSTTNIDDVGFIDTLLDVLIARYNIDTNRIYATGMSNGGFMSYRLACELSHRIAAIAPIASSMSLIECNPGRPVPIIHFHSYQDGSVPYEGGIGNGISDHYNAPLDSVLAVWAATNACQEGKIEVQDNDDYTQYTWTNCDCASDIIWYLTKDGGHSWPGGNQTPIGDLPSMVINANELMWDFLSQYSLDCSAVSAWKEIPVHDQLHVFPNPSYGSFQLSQSPDLADKVSLFDLLGTPVPIIREGANVTVPSFEAGLYLLKIVEQAQQIRTTRLLLIPAN